MKQEILNNGSKNSCPDLLKEFKFFDDLIIDIKMRKTLFEAFEKYLKEKKVTRDFLNNNDFCHIIVRGHLVQQISDFGKFFDRDERAYSFKFVIKHTADDFKKKHQDLFKIWEHKLKKIKDKVFHHSQKDLDKSLDKIEIRELDSYTNKFFQFFEEVAITLAENYQISSSNFSNNDEAYLNDVWDDVESFFDMLNNK